MRVALDTTFARRAPLSGTGIYIERVAAALEGLGAEVLREANLRRPEPSGGGPGSVRNLALDVLWSGVGLPARAAARGAELVHHTLPGALLPHRMPQVVTVLDLAFERFPQHFDRGFRTYASAVHRAAARRADAVICISEATAADVVELWGLAYERIVVAPLGPGQVLAVPQDRHERYLLYVGDAEPRKDLGTLLAAHRRYRELAGAAALPLVLAGSAWADAEGVRVESRPSPARLGELLGDAAALVHPAVHEGFGMTVLEAMGAGVPVIAARSDAAAEVGGDAVELVGPGDAEAMARAMLRLASDPPRGAELARLGRERAARFSWERCARAHLAAYALALGR